MTAYGSIEGGLANLVVDPPDHLAPLQESADGLLAHHGGVARLRGLRGSATGFDPVVWREMAAAGWLGLLLPEADGGIGLGHLEMCVLAERLGMALAPEPFLGAGVLALSMLADAEAGPLRDRLLEPALSGELTLAVAWKADPADAPAIAVENGRLVGRAALVWPIDGVDGFIAYANGADGPGLFWAPRDAAGLTIARDLLVDGGHAGRLSFDGVEALPLPTYTPAASVLGNAVDRARLAASAELVGVMKQAFDMTVAYLQVRTQFGKQIASFQAIQHRFADLFIQYRLACAAVLEAAAVMDSDSDADAKSAAVSAAKARAGSAAGLITREAIQLHGAIGYTDEHDIGLYLKRALVLAAWLGDSASHRRRFARLSPAT